MNAPPVVAVVVVVVGPMACGPSLPVLESVTINICGIICAICVVAEPPVLLDLPGKTGMLPEETLAEVPVTRSKSPLACSLVAAFGAKLTNVDAVVVVAVGPMACGPSLPVLESVTINICGIICAICVVAEPPVLLDLPGRTWMLPEVTRSKSPLACSLVDVVVVVGVVVVVVVVVRVVVVVVAGAVVGTLAAHDGSHPASWHVDICKHATKNITNDKFKRGQHPEVDICSCSSI